MTKVKFQQVFKDGFETYLVNEDHRLQFFGDSETYFDEGTEVVLALKPITIDGVQKNLIGLISDYTAEPVDLETLEEDYGLKDGEYVVTPIVEYLQDQLIEDKDNILTITCAGFEERTSGSYSPFGDVTVISKFNTKFKALRVVEDEIVEELRQQYK